MNVIGHPLPFISLTKVSDRVQIYIGKVLPSLVDFTLSMRRKGGSYCASLLMGEARIVPTALRQSSSLSRPPPTNLLSSVNFGSSRAGGSGDGANHNSNRDDYTGSDEVGGHYPSHRRQCHRVPSSRSLLRALPPHNTTTGITSSPSPIFGGGRSGAAPTASQADVLTDALRGFLAAQSETLMRRCLKVILFELGRLRYSVHRPQVESGALVGDGGLWIQLVERASYFQSRGMTFEADGAGSGGHHQEYDMVEVVLLLHRHLGEVRAQRSTSASIAASAPHTGPRGSAARVDGGSFRCCCLDDPTFVGRFTACVTNMLLASSSLSAQSARPSLSPWRFLLENFLGLFPGVSAEACEGALLFREELLPAIVLSGFLQLVESPTGTVSLSPPTGLPKARGRGGLEERDPTKAGDEGALREEARHRDAMRRQISKETNALAHISAWLKCRRRADEDDAANMPLSYPSRSSSSPDSEHQYMVRFKPLFQLRSEECVIVLDQLVGTIAALAHRSRDNRFVQQLLVAPRSESPTEGTASFPMAAPEVVGAGASSPLFAVLEAAMASRIRNPSRYLQCDPLNGQALLNAYFLPAAAVLASSSSSWGCSYVYANEHACSTSPASAADATADDLSSLNRGTHLCRLVFILYRYTGLLGSDSEATPTAPRSGMGGPFTLFSSSSNDTRSSTERDAVEQSTLVVSLLCEALRTAFHDPVVFPRTGGMGGGLGLVVEPATSPQEEELQQCKEATEAGEWDARESSAIERLCETVLRSHSALALYGELHQAVAVDVRVSMVDTLLKGLASQMGTAVQTALMCDPELVAMAQELTPPPTRGDADPESNPSRPAALTLSHRQDDWLQAVSAKVLSRVVERLLFDGLRPLWRDAFRDDTHSSRHKLCGLLSTAAGLFGSIRSLDDLSGAALEQSNSSSSPAAADVLLKIREMVALVSGGDGQLPTAKKGTSPPPPPSNGGSLLLYAPHVSPATVRSMLERVVARGRAISGSPTPAAAAAVESLPPWAIGGGSLPLVWFSLCLLTMHQQPLNQLQPPSAAALPTYSLGAFSALNGTTHAPPTRIAFASRSANALSALLTLYTLGPTQHAHLLDDAAVLDGVYYLPFVTRGNAGMSLEALAAVAQSVCRWVLASAKRPTARGEAHANEEQVVAPPRAAVGNSPPTAAAMQEVLSLLLATQAPAQHIGGDGRYGGGCSEPCFDTICSALDALARGVLSAGEASGMQPLGSDTLAPFTPAASGGRNVCLATVGGVEAMRDLLSQAHGAVGGVGAGRNGNGRPGVCDGAAHGKGGAHGKTADMVDVLGLAADASELWFTYDAACAMSVAERVIVFAPPLDPSHPVARVIAPRLPRGPRIQSTPVGAASRKPSANSLGSLLGAATRRLPLLWHEVEQAEQVLRATRSAPPTPAGAPPLSAAVTLLESGLVPSLLLPLLRQGSAGEQLTPNPIVSHPPAAPQCSPSSAAAALLRGSLIGGQQSRVLKVTSLGATAGASSAHGAGGGLAALSHEIRR